MIRVSLTLLVLAALSAPVVASEGQTCEEHANESLADDLYVAALSCLGSKQDEHSLSIDFYGATPNLEKGEVTLRAANVQKALELLHAAAVEQARAQRNWQVLVDYLANRIDGLKSATDDSTKLHVLSRMSPDAVYDIEGDRGRVRLLSENLYIKPGDTEHIDDHCPPEGTACPHYQALKPKVRILKLLDRLDGYAYYHGLAAHYDDAKLGEKKWAAYFEDTRHQWWWEYYVNGRRMLADEDTENRVRQGFREVPNDQLILFHPDVAFYWDDSANASSELRAVPVIEVIGKYRWQWAADGSVEKGSGWSVIAAYNEVEDGRAWGAGLMYHYRNRFSLGVTSTKGDVGVLLSIDLSDKLFERKEKYKSYLEKVDRDAFSDVLFNGGSDADAQR